MAEMTVSKEKQQRQVKEHERDWLELPSVITANILNRIGVVDKLENVQKVCTTWRKICKDPAMWRVIHMKNIPGPVARKQGMCKHAVDRSQGQLIDINLVHFYDNALLQYVADRSSQLKRLELLFRNYDCRLKWSQLLKKFSMLEELNLYKVRMEKQDIETAGRCCPMLRTLKLNRHLYELGWKYQLSDIFMYPQYDSYSYWKKLT